MDRIKVSWWRLMAEKSSTRWCFAALQRHTIGLVELRGRYHTVWVGYGIVLFLQVRVKILFFWSRRQDQDQCYFWNIHTETKQRVPSIPSSQIGVFNMKAYSNYEFALWSLSCKWVLNQGARDVNEDLLLHIVVLFVEEWTPPTLPYRHIQYEYNDLNYLFYCFISSSADLEIYFHG